MSLYLKLISSFTSLCKAKSIYMAGSKDVVASVARLAQFRS